MDPHRLDRDMERLRRRYENYPPEQHHMRWDLHPVGNQNPTQRGRGRHRRKRNYTIIGLAICLVILTGVVCVVWLNASHH